MLVKLIKISMPPYKDILGKEYPAAFLDIKSSLRIFGELDPAIPVSTLKARQNAHGNL